MKFKFSGFGTTVVNGIQEISALLPLLGIVQCEEHVGSALYKGFIYVCISPISIFGSLGIVKAGFNIFLASLNIQPIHFLGAKKLRDGGFHPKGAVAPMIALDPQHPNRYLVESKLESMLADENINNNVGDLTVSWNEENLIWNLKLVLFTLLSAPLGLAPYLFIILKPQHRTDRADPFFLGGWGFPIIRILGSVICVVVVQFLIQIRILVIIRMRLLFMSIDRIAKDMNVDLESKYHHLTWNSLSKSETCIWDLENWLQLFADEEKYGTNLKQCFEAARRRQFPPQSRLAKFIRPSMYFTFHTLLAAGLVMSLIGYIGCFNLVSNASEKSAGPIIWVALEAVQSVLRITVWAFNPSWDDSKGITFNLKLASHSPLITCSKSDSDIKADGVVSVARSSQFLEELVVYTGPLPSFNWNNVALYYILTAEDAPSPCPPDASLHAILYVIISDYKEQTCRALTKRSGDDNKFDIYISSLESDRGSTMLNVKFKTTNDGRPVLTLPETHSLTADARFMDDLSKYYDKIISQLQKRKEVIGFRTTWDLRRSDESILQRKMFEEEESVEELVVMVYNKAEKNENEVHLHQDKPSEETKFRKEEVMEKKMSKEDREKASLMPREKVDNDYAKTKQDEDGDNEERVKQERVTDEGVKAQEDNDEKNKDEGGKEGDDGEKNENTKEKECGQKEEGEGAEKEESGQGPDEEDTERRNYESQDNNKVNNGRDSFSGSFKASVGQNLKRCLLRLTPEDVVYIRQGQIERRWKELFERLEEWAEMFVALYSVELLQDVPPNLVFPPGKSISLVQKYEANEVEYLLIECQTQLETFLRVTSSKWDVFVQTNHGRMVMVLCQCQCQ